MFFQEQIEISRTVSPRLRKNRDTALGSPTDNEPRSCRSASACSRVQQRSQLRKQHRRQQTILSHSGTARSVAALCTLSNGFLQLNSCFALHLNPTGALHELYPQTSDSACSGTQAGLFSHLTQNALSPISSACTWRLSATPFRTIPNSTRSVQPITTSSQTLPP
jgi:hypothetical protein